MKDCIIIPNWLYIESIFSTRIRRFLDSAVYLDNNKIDMESLREYYKSNQNSFSDLVHELSLRGFEFYSNKPNNLLPSLSYGKNEDCISVYNNSNNYLNIDFEKLGIGNFISRFNVCEDYFFNGIPIKGFKVFYPNLNMDNIVDEFSKNGFSVINSRNFLNIKKLSMNAIDKTNKAGDYTNISGIKRKYYNIEDYFPQNEYPAFQRFCKEKNIESLTDITYDNIGEFYKYKGIGEMKLEGMTDRLLELLLSIKLDNLEENDRLRVFYQNVNENPNNYTIDNYFAHRKYLLFSNFCNKKNLIAIDDIKYNHIQQFAMLRGVGVKKQKELKYKLLEIILNAKIIETVDSINDESIFSKLEGLNLENHDIEDCFSEGKHILFREFCKENQIKNIGDIKEYHMEEFSKKRGVGVGKIKDINKRILEIVSLVIENENENEDRTFNINDSFYPYIMDMYLSELFNICKCDYKGEDYLIGDIQGKYIKDLEDKNNIQALDLIDVLNLVNSLVLPKEILTKSEKTLSEREIFILKSRYIEGMTLKEVGDIINLTRERIRQLESKAIRKIRNKLKVFQFELSLKLNMENKEYISREDLIKITGKNNLYVINIIIENNIMGMRYFEPLDILYFEKFEANIEGLHKIIDYLPNIFELDDYMEDIEEIINIYYKKDIGLEEIKRFLSFYNYRKYGSYFSKGKMNIIDMLDILYKDYIKEPITLDEEGALVINNLFEKVFNYEYNGSIRAIDGRTRDLENVILVSNKTFQHIDHINYDKSIMYLIENYIDKYFKEYGTINVETLFVEFEGICKKNNIQDKLALYSLIKYHFGDKYNIGQGNTLNIYRDESGMEYGREEKVIMYLRERSGIGLKNEILKDLDWKDFKLEDTVSKSDKILGWGTGKVILLEKLKIDDHIRGRIRTLLEETMVDGFTTSFMIFKKMLFDPKFNEFLTNNEIDDHRKLATLIRTLFNDIKGHTNFIYKEGSKYINMEDVIMERFNDVCTRQKVKDFIIEYGYKDAMAGSIIDKLIQQEKYVEISQDEILPHKNVSLDEYTIRILSEEISRRMGDKKYISLSNLKGYRKALPSIDYRWNPYLIKTVLDGRGFRAINKYNGDYRYDKVILVKEDSEIKTFEDLIYYILTNEYEGNLHEIKVYDYLAMEGILIEQEEIFRKKLPYEIKISNRIKIDDIGRIEIC